MATKQDVLNFLKHNRTMLTARNLYNKLAGKNLATQSYLANLPNTEKNVRIASYELCKLAGISERQMNALLSQPITQQKVAPKAPETPKGPTAEQMQERLLGFDAKEATLEEIDEFAQYLGIKVDFPEFSKGLVGNKERKAFAEKNNIVVTGKKKSDFETAFKLHEGSVKIQGIIKAKEALIESKLQELDVKTKESIKLREQFPFLKEKNCPRVLHLLVADLITAHENFVANQPLLHQHATQAQMEALVKTVNASYIEKKEAFAELEHYKKTGEIKGVHPLFERLKQEEALQKLETPELTKKISNLTSNINRNKNKLKEAKTPSDKNKYQNLVDTQIALKIFAETELGNRK